MKKIIGIIAFAASLFLVSSVAMANNVSELNIEASIRDDGSAYITQTWTGEFDEGTENYIPINSSATVKDLTVSDALGEYENVGEWDIDRSFDEKARKCGINYTSDGVELCWGISEYGQNRYAIEYVVENFIKSYSDYDGTNFMFVNPDMSTFPTDASVHIFMENQTPLSSENAAIWAFGFNGQINFDNNGILAHTDEPLSGGERMIILLQMNKGIITPIYAEDRSFEDVKNTAFENSDYTKESDLPDWFYNCVGILVILLIAAFIISVIIKIIKSIMRSIAIKKFCHDAQYFRETPNHGDLELTNFLVDSFDIQKDDSLIIGATMLAMINKHVLEPIEEEKTGLFGKTKTSTSLKLCKMPTEEPQIALYKILKKAAGSDGILQEKELEKYAKAHYETIESFSNNCTANGSVRFVNLGGYNDKEKNNIENLSDVGIKELSEAVGLKKYLEDFSLIDERELKEIDIWQEYLVYAALFGVASAVIKQLKKLYPTSVATLDEYDRNIIIAGSYRYTMYHSAVSAANAARNAGSGGSSSFGGGGGFSGGGSGGGSR